MRKVRSKEFGAVLVGKLTLEFFSNDDENLKNRNIQSMMKELRKEENVSICSLGNWLENPERGELVFSVVAATRDQAQAIYDRVTKFIDNHSIGRIISDDFRLEEL